VPQNREAIKLYQHLPFEATWHSQ